MYLFPFAFRNPLYNSVLHLAITLLYRLTALLFSTLSRCLRSFAFPRGLQPPAFSPLLSIMTIYYAFDTNIGVWSPSAGLQVLSAILAAYLSSPGSEDTLPDIYVQSAPVRELYI